MRTKDEQTKKSYRLDGKITTELQTFTYDHADRLLTQTHSLDNLPQVTLTENSYDNLCRLSSKRVMGEQISYDYNIRNWLTAITSPHYSQAMTYNLDGNMNAMQWRHDSATTPQGYNFSYDGLSRLKQAVFTGGETPDEFSTHYAYDLNGNITELYRNATDIDGYLAVMDEITMNYNGNQLTQADNSSDEDTAYEGVRYHGGSLLTYDENGCLTADLDKNISSIQYNSLNLPTYMRLSTASASIRYQYDSEGNKLQETRISRRPKMRHETSYCGNFVFENKALKRILVDGGFIYFGENDTTYHYFLKDHLGSNRAVVNAKTRQVVEKYDYYPFGKQHGDYHTGYIHPYRYNGKELENAMGIDWLYYGARMMEPEWGRFTTPDPLAEKYYDVSPYTYCNNNPVNYIDLRGDSITMDNQSIMAIYNGLAEGSHIKMKFNNGVLDPSSIADVANNTEDTFLQDLYEIAINSQMVELKVTDKNEYIENGIETSKTWNAPMDYNIEKSFSGPALEQCLKLGYQKGTTITGNLGQTLYPIQYGEYKSSRNGNIQILINSKGTLNHQSVGIAHEFAHVTLFLRGLPHSHSKNGDYIYNRQFNVMKRLGYDYVDR